MRGDARGGGVTLVSDTGALLATERTCNAAAGRFLVDEMVVDRVNSGEFKWPCACLGGGAPRGTAAAFLVGLN